MPTVLKLVAQQVQDLFYQDYKAAVDFFTSDDFILYTGNTITGIYQAYYQEKYKELLSEKKDEVIQFDSGMLSEQILDVVRADNKIFAKIVQPIMTFMYDTQNTGVQNVFVTKPTGNFNELERATLSQTWQFDKLPATDRIFFYVEIGKIRFFNKGNCNVNQVQVLYIPSMYPDALIPDGIIDQAIQRTIQAMKVAADKTVIKETLDQNKNKVLEFEANKEQAK